jgi:hypothetical protein
MMAEDEAIDRISQKIRNDLLFEDIYPIQHEVEYLRKLVIEHRVWIISRRLYAWADRILAQDTPDATKLSARIAQNEVDRAMLYFQGAIRETKDPYEVFGYWLERLRKLLAQQGLSNLLREDDALPPRPMPPP